MYIIVESKPTEGELRDHVVTEVTTRWSDLGVKLLNSVEVEIIRKDHPNDGIECCKAMFSKWLQTKTDASWKQLIAALRSPGVALPVLATTLQEKFSGL